MSEEEKPQQIEEPQIAVEEDSSTGEAARVILFNDDWHSFEEVIVQLIKAVNCTFAQARAYAFQVHVEGKAVVFHGSMNDCLKVSSILEEIELHTQVVM